VYFCVIKKIEYMATIALKGNEIHTQGELPLIGTTFVAEGLVAKDLSEVSTAAYQGKKLVLNIFPSIDTGTCAMSVRTFNEKASQMDNTQVLCISVDLPFAMNRFCGAEGIENVTTLSAFRSSAFDFLKMVDGPLKGLTSRVVIALDENGVVTHTEQVADIVDEPQYNF
jgi:thiol peroxidase